MNPLLEFLLTVLALLAVWMVTFAVISVGAWVGYFLVANLALGVRFKRWWKR